MFDATAKKLYDFSKEGISLSGHETSLLIFGNIVAFLVAMFAIRSFIALLNRTGFKWFGVYRIIVGGILIVLFLLGIDVAVV
jgi:undecaprenyl-diphosphatase